MDYSNYGVEETTNAILASEGEEFEQTIRSSRIGYISTAVVLFLIFGGLDIYHWVMGDNPVNTKHFFEFVAGLVAFVVFMPMLMGLANILDAARRRSVRIEVKLNLLLSRIPEPRRSDITKGKGIHPIDEMLGLANEVNDSPPDCGGGAQ